MDKLQLLNGGSVLMGPCCGRVGAGSHPSFVALPTCTLAEFL